jgi:signal recognition particle receptor subunit beta
MVLFNYSTKELTAKIVYYGPGLCGKTTNLQYIFGNLPAHVHKGKMLSLATQTDRTLFFDFLPIDLGNIRGMKTRLQLYTVPGQVFYNTTRKLVLKGADGVVFVADSQRKMVDANIESYGNLEENLREHGMILAELPHILQFNKRDLADLLTPDELNTALNKYNAPIYESVATTGIGVQETLKAVTRLVLNSLREKYGERKRVAERKMPVAATAAAAVASPTPPGPVEVAPASAAAPEPVLEVAPEAPPGAPPPAPADEPVLEVAQEVSAEPAVGEEGEEPILTVSEEGVEEAVTVEVEEPSAAAVEVEIEEPPGADEEAPVLEVAEEAEAGATIEEESPLQVEEVELPAPEPTPSRGVPVVASGEEAEMESVLEVEEEPVVVAEPQPETVVAPPEVSAKVAVEEVPLERGAAEMPELAAPELPDSAATPASQVATFPLSLDVRGETVHLKVSITLTVEKA